MTQTDTPPTRASGRTIRTAGRVPMHPSDGQVPDPASAGASARRLAGTWQRWLPLAVVLLGTAALTLPLIWGGVRLGQDSATQFYPWYHNLGERLRAGGVPEWNPHQFGGAPLAADPQSGWMYLPAMLAFTLLPLGAAVVVQIFGHLLLANLGLWLLARRLGLGPVAALVAGFAFAGSGVLYGRIPSGPASYEVGAWLPWVLLGAELALTARTWPVRIAAWSLAGLAVSQALVAWVGQVSYYTLLLLAAWIAYRVLLGGTASDGSRPGGRWAAAVAPVGSLAGTPQPRPASVERGALTLAGSSADEPHPPAPSPSRPSRDRHGRSRSWPDGEGEPNLAIERPRTGLLPFAVGEGLAPSGLVTRLATLGTWVSRTPGPLRGADGASPAPTTCADARLGLAGALQLNQPETSRRGDRAEGPRRAGPGSRWRWSRAGARGEIVTILGRLALHGLAMLLIGLGLSAAGLLPRLEFNAVSNAAGGEYATAVGGVIGGSTSESVITRLFQPTIYYPGAAVLALAVIGILLGRGRFGLPFWLVTALAAIVLTVPVLTPLHRLLYLLPLFRQLHEHWPERVILVAFPGLALMAGAGVQALVDAARAATRPGPVPRAVAVVLPGLILAGFALRGATISWIATAGVVGVAALSAALLFGGRRSGRSAGWAVRPARHWVPAALFVVVAADLLLMNQALAGQGPFGGFHRRDLGPYYAPSGAAAFLQERAARDGPFRFAGYDPAIQTMQNGQPVLYRYQFAEPATRELTVNNRATMLGLEDIQGYDPLQVAAWVDLVTALNGAPQEYHGSDVYPTGLASPLLGLLNVRYLLIPSSFGSDRTDLAGLVAAWATVYDDGTTRVIENPTALPRLWAVERTRTVPAGEALPLLASGMVDPRTTALFEPGTGPTPPDVPVAEPGAAAPVLTLTDSGDPDTVRFTAMVDRPTVVVLSEVAYPAWTARIDGQPAELLTADHTLRAVVVPAGAHEVTLRYDSPATRYGLLITLATVVVVLGGWLVALWRTGQRSTPLAPANSDARRGALERDQHGAPLRPVSPRRDEARWGGVGEGPGLAISAETY